MPASGIGSCLVNSLVNFIVSADCDFIVQIPNPDEPELKIEDCKLNICGYGILSILSK
jgi:hypothetical protein